MDLELVKRVGIAAAYRAAEVIRSHLGRISQVRKKGPTDLVTEADTGSEARILATIGRAFPHHSILAEESGLKKGSPKYQWLIDPLDGTTNFAHRLPGFCVSIAFAIESRVVVGLVLDPISRELFSAIAGKGAQLNGKPIQVSSTSAVSESLLATGFSHDFKDHFKPSLRRFEKLMLACQGVRRIGSAALDLCFVACGRFDGFWETHLAAWDTAAGMLIAKEAGAQVTDFSNMPFAVTANEILATNGHIHQPMLALLALGDNEK